MNSPPVRQLWQPPYRNDDGTYLHDVQTSSMLFENKHADAGNVFYVSAVLERATQRKFGGCELTIWIYDEPHSQDLSIIPIDDSFTGAIEAESVALPDSAPSTPLQETMALASLNDTDSITPAADGKPVCQLQLQLYVTEGSEIVSPCGLELKQGALPAPSRILHRKTVLLDGEESSYGRILIGHFMLSRPLYRVFTESRPSPDVPTDSPQPCYINHISARVLCPDPSRRGMPPMAPELVERIFANAVQRTCDWPGCRIHASMNLWLLAQVNTQWHSIARRLHKTRESVSKKLIELCTMFEWHERPPVPESLSAMITDERCYFSLSTIFEGKAAKKFQGIDLNVTVYGSEVPLPEISVSYLGDDPSNAPLEPIEIDTKDPDVLCYPINLRFDTWGPSEEITAYQISGESYASLPFDAGRTSFSIYSPRTWSSRIVYSRRIILPKSSSPFHLGWFKTSKPLCLDRDASMEPYHFAARISIPNPRRKAAKNLPPSILERIFNAAWSASDDGGLFGMPMLSYAPVPSWTWTQDLRRFAGDNRDWAEIAKKLFRFETMLSQISGYTHASCYSFQDSAPSPNHIFAVTAIFDGNSAEHFDGACLTVCVPEEGVWSDVDVLYLGDTYANGQVSRSTHLKAIQEGSSKGQGERECDADIPICPLSLCLCTSADDGDSYHVAVKDFPQTRSLITRRILFNKESKSSKCIFFGYFHSSRAFTGSATSAIPVHVVRVSLPDPKRKRFRKLPDTVIERIATGVTQLSDSLRRTDAWEENLKMMALVNRSFHRAAMQRLKQIEEEAKEGDPFLVGSKEVEKRGNAEVESLPSLQPAFSSSTRDSISIGDALDTTSLHRCSTS